MRAILTVGLLLAGAVTLGAQEQTGTIMFYREARFARSQFSSFLFCDGVELARMEGGTYFQVTAPVGLHSCTVDSLQRPAIDVNVVSRETAYVHVELQNGIRNHAPLANTTNDEYVKKKRLKPLRQWSRNVLGVEPLPSVDSETSNTSAQSGSRIRGPDKDRHSGRFGDLVITVTKLIVVPFQQDRAELKAFVSVMNTGNGVICANLNATLNTSLPLISRRYW
jgi:hypothetical protein